MTINLQRIKRWLLAATLVAFVFGATCLFILYFTNSGYEFRSNAKKYVDMNIPQNWGIRKKILIKIDQFLAIFPIEKNIEFNKEYAPQGAKISKSAIYSLLASSKNIVEVEDEKSLVFAISNAEAGDFILVSPGTYTINQRNIRTNSGGKKGKPIVLAASRLGEVELKLNSLEGLLITRPYWIIKNIAFEGVCRHDSSCEHAIHLYGDADYLLLDNNVFRNFNSPLKSNGNYSTAIASFPDFVTVSNNDFYNNGIRKTRSPATPIDVVGGNYWKIHANFIADFSRKQTGKVSVVYGAYLKGGGKHGEFTDNVINCAWRLPHQNSLDVRVGLSFGNGGTGSKYCQVKDCQYEHFGGLIDNNIILNCENDVSIYLNKATNTKVTNNIILNSLGIDARYSSSSVSIIDNIMHGRIKSRDGAFISKRNNQYLSENQELPRF